MNKTSFTIAEFIAEMYSFKYSKEYFELLQEAAEYNLMTQYANNMRMIPQLNQELSEAGIVLEEHFFQDYDKNFIQSFTEDGENAPATANTTTPAASNQDNSVTAGTPNIFVRLWNKIQQIWRKFVLSCKRFFAGQHINDVIKPQDKEKFRDTIKNTEWTEELIDKIIISDKVDYNFWIQQNIPITDPDVNNLVFSNNVKEIKKACFKKYCMFILTDKDIELEAESLRKLAGKNEDQQNAIDSAQAKTKAKFAPVSAIRNWFNKITNAKTKQEVEQAGAELEKEINDNNGKVKLSVDGKSDKEELSKLQELDKKIKDWGKKLSNSPAGDYATSALAWLGKVGPMIASTIVIKAGSSAFEKYLSTTFPNVFGKKDKFKIDPGGDIFQYSAGESHMKSAKDNAGNLTLKKGQDVFYSLTSGYSGDQFEKWLRGSNDRQATTWRSTNKQIDSVENPEDNKYVVNFTLDPYANTP